MFDLWLDLLYPPACPLCRVRISRANDTVCSDCERAFPRIREPRSLRYELSLDAAFDAAVSPFAYTGSAVSAVRAFKYHHRSSLGRWMGERMTEQVKRALPIEAVDAVVPVPSHWMKRWMRDGAPAHDLGKFVARRLDKPFLPGALRQKRWHRSQTKLSREQRLRNVAASLEANEPIVRGRRVLLVDDVLTTGATASACAQALKQAGAGSVYVLTAARTPKLG